MRLEYRCKEYLQDCFSLYETFVADFRANADQQEFEVDFSHEFVINLIHSLLFTPVFNWFINLLSYISKPLLIERLFNSFGGTLGAVDCVQTRDEQFNHVTHHLFIFDDEIYVSIAQLECQTLPSVEWFFP